MLKTWKDASQGQPQRPHVKEKDSCQDAQSRRMYSGGPSVVTADASPSNSGAVLDSAHALASSVTKRARDGEDRVENAKKRKRGPSVSVRPVSLSTLVPTTEGTYEQTRSRNSIVIVDSFDDAISHASRFLESTFVWSTVSPEVVSSSGRISLFIVDETVSPESVARRLANETRVKVTSWSGSVSPARWPTLMEYQVVVSSIDALLERLTEGIMIMSQLRALVIFDVACTSSALMTVLECFYRTENADVGPSILALRSSARTADISQLEQLLEAKATSKLATTTFSRLRPLEVVVQYEAPSPSRDTKLTERIRAIQFSESLFFEAFSVASYITRELGPCGCDLLWRRRTKGSALEVEDGGEVVAKVKSELQNLIKSWSFAMPNVNLTSRGCNVSPKFARLIQILKTCKLHGDKFRGIIFVQEREVAAIMADMLCMVAQDLGFLRPLALTELDGNNIQDVCRGFATGEFNLLVVPKSLEDLDIPSALIVVRYGVYESQLSYAYSCARTVRALGYLVHMVENGNDVERRVLSHYQHEKFDERWIEVVTSGGGSPIPSRPLIENCVLPDGPDENVGPCIVDPTTSGRLYERDAVCALYRLVSSMLHMSETSHKSLFVVRQGSCDPLSCEWICDVLLPSKLLTEQVSGPPRPTPAHARRAAAFITCVRLYEYGAFDHRLFLYPRSAMKTQELANADTISGNRCYPRKRTPFWSNSLRLFSHKWFPVILHVQGREKHAPMLLLTRQPLPHMPACRLFIEGVPTVVQNARAAPVEISADHLHALQLFTIRICRAVLNKPFACSADDVVYLFAPLRSCVTGNLQSTGLRRILDYVPWDVVFLAGKEWAVRFDPDFGSLQGVEDMVVQDRMVEFTRRYYALRLRQDLTPLSKPEDSPREAGYSNFVEYCKARRKGFDGLRDYQQPMIEVAKIAGVSNHLNPVFQPLAVPTRAGAKYLIPELSAKSTIPASTFRTALVLPSVMRRIEDFLIVQELNAVFFNHSIYEEHLFAAISAPSAGYEVDYERLELFGDAFLKYLASIYVFVMHPSQHGVVHAARQCIISNEVLMQSAVRSGLPQFIQGKPFSYKLWHPPNFTADSFPGSNFVGDENANSERGGTARKKKSHDESVTQWLGDKTIADVVEAIIGAAYLSGGQETALQAVKSMQVPIPNVEQWDDFRRKACPPPPDPTALLRAGSVEAVEAITGRQNSNPHILGWALIHPSIDGNGAEYNEQLEFIGDAILDFMVVRYIVGRYGKLSPGAMTMLKVAMVSNSALAALCVSSGLYRHLHYDSHSLARSFEAYVKKVEAWRLEETKIAAQNDRSPGQYWLDIESPKALSDLVESIIGALFIQDGYQLAGTEIFFNKVLRPFYDRYVTLKTLSHHPTKILSDLLQKHGCQQFELVKETCDAKQEAQCDVVVHEIILASATASTVHAAGRAASLAALDALEGDANFMNGTCTCRSSSRGKRARKMLIDEMVAEIDVETAS